MAETPTASHDRSPATSLTLLQRLRGGEADAWQTMVGLYSPLVSYWCRRAGVHESDVDDLLQEVFRRASASLSHFRRDRPGDTFRGWLRGVTRNTILEYRRTAKRQPRADGGTDAFLQMQQFPDAGPIDDEDDPVQLGALYRRALEVVRSEFEERTWQMFWCIVVDERAPVDVAAQLGVTPAAVRKAKSRVLHRLKLQVGDLID